MSEIFMKIKFKMARIVPAPFKVFTPFVAFVVTGCVSVANYRTNLQTWVGQSEQVLEETWGAPTSIQQFGNVRQITFIRNNGAEVFNGYWQPRVQSLYCTTTFSIENGIIIQARYIGNECVSY